MWGSIRPRHRGSVRGVCGEECAHPLSTPLHDHTVITPPALIHHDVPINHSVLINRSMMNRTPVSAGCAAIGVGGGSRRVETRAVSSRSDQRRIGCGVTDGRC